jgi:hypothetical protein
MHRIRLVTVSAVALILAAGGAVLHGSDPIAVYARVDRVVLAPDANAPQTIQIFGVFSLAKEKSGNDYEPPARGYLYFTLGGDEKLARRAWADLKAMAGTSQIVAFGTRYDMKVRLRPETETPDAPDPFVAGSGLTKVNGSTEYGPIRALADFRK